MECAICLELLLLEHSPEYYEVIRDDTKIIRLPCKCASSFFHSKCLWKMLKSGNEKNFCPCCRTMYYFLLPSTKSERNNAQIMNTSQNVLGHGENFVEERENELEGRIQQIVKWKLKFIFFLHLVLNTIQNILFWYYSTQSLYKNKIDIKWIFITMLIKIFMNLIFCCGAFENENFSHGTAICFNNALQCGVIFLFVYFYKWKIDFFYLASFIVCFLLDIGQFLHLSLKVYRMRSVVPN